MVSCLECQTRLGLLFLALYPLRTRWGQLEHISGMAKVSLRLQTDVQSHFVFVRKLLSAKPSFEVVRIRSCACACAQSTWNCPLHTGDGSREKISQAPVGKLSNNQKFFLIITDDQL